MNKLIFVFIALAFTLVNASVYGHAAGGYGAAPAANSYGAPPPVLYNIPPPSYLNPLPAQYGDAWKPVQICDIKKGGAPGALIGAGSNAKASASAASANVPLRPGAYKLLVVPSYVVADTVVPTGGAYGAPAAAGYGVPAAAY